MIYNKFILIMVFAFTANISFGQDPINFENFNQKWYLSYKSTSDTLIFNIIDRSEMHFGKYLILKNDGTYNEGCSAQCGNDPNIYYKTGTWKINHRKNIILTSEPIFKKGKKFRLVSIYSRKMILKAI
ncbi:MAG: hypothetical protein GY756_27650 [bacterium]|nr:hypothetical protein [bacterium]